MVQASAASDPEQRAPAAARQAPSAQRDMPGAAALPFGRAGWPPPPGSGWDALMDWAAEGGWPTEEDTSLAFGLFLGWLPHPGPEPGRGGADGPCWPIRS